MRYAVSCCQVTEVGKTFVYEGPCIECEKTQKVTVPVEELTLYRQGAFMQHAFKSLNHDQREFLMSGICGECWKRIFIDSKEVES